MDCSISSSSSINRSLFRLYAKQAAKGLEAAATKFFENLPDELLEITQVAEKATNEDLTDVYLVLCRKMSQSRLSREQDSGVESEA